MQRGIVDTFCHPLVEKLNGAINAHLAEASVKAKFHDLEGSVIGRSPAEHIIRSCRGHFWSRADIDRQTKPVESVENDPKET
jgi:hypothetical protein